MKWSNEDKANKRTMEKFKNSSRKARGLCEVLLQPASCLRKTSMASFHVTKIQHSKFLSYINIESKELCIFNVTKYYVLLTSLLRFTYFMRKKRNLYCSIHVAAFIKRSLIMLSERTLQMDYFILESSGLQWISIKLIKKILNRHTHQQQHPHAAVMKMN